MPPRPLNGLTAVATDDHMATKLDQYRGTLTAEQIAAGINCANRNAMRLLEDAKLLLANGRFPSACSLAALSIEESGKASILRRIACAANENEARKLWREYRSHTAKNVLWLLPQLVSRGARQLQNFADLFSEESDHPHVLDQVKQISFYTDCLGSAHWSEPSDVIDEKLAQTLVATAALMARDKEITAAEIDLWVKVVGPHLNGTRADAEAALQEWFAQTQYLGLAPAGENAMKTFIFEGIRSSGRDARRCTGGRKGRKGAFYFLKRPPPPKPSSPAQRCRPRIKIRPPNLPFPETSAILGIS